MMMDNGFRERHAQLSRSCGGVGDPDDPKQVQAMQVVLHLPKHEPPKRSAVLAAAAAACVSLCLDERVGVDGEWRQRYLAWTATRIRKVTRRARGAHWQAANDVAGVTVDIDGARARALVPGPVGELDPRIDRLQIGGTDLVHDDPGDPAPGISVFWVNSVLEMTVGKTAAQVGHAAMLPAGTMTVEEALAWSLRGYRCSVREADPEQWVKLQALVAQGQAVAVKDAGFTEVLPGSITVTGLFG